MVQSLAAGRRNGLTSPKATACFCALSGARIGVDCLRELYLTRGTLLPCQITTPAQRVSCCAGQPSHSYAAWNLTAYAESGDASSGIMHDQQILRGPSGSPILRWQRAHRQDGATLSGMGLRLVCLSHDQDPCNWPSF